MDPLLIVSIFGVVAAIAYFMFLYKVKKQPYGISVPVASRQDIVGASHELIAGELDDGDFYTLTVSEGEGVLQVVRLNDSYYVSVTSRRDEVVDYLKQSGFSKAEGNYDYDTLASMDIGLGRFVQISGEESTFARVEPDAEVMAQLALGIMRQVFGITNVRNLTLHRAKR